ncbi:MAG: response regulator transcription factor [Candidatus Didemnitutus sp.]|nr:response regulator transcription factor [Candidatus Didemnitutus sp.]
MPPVNAPTNKIRTCVVDGQLSVRRSVARWLESDADIELLAQLANGGEATRFLAKEQPDLVIVGTDLPDMRGFKLVEAMNAGQPPVVVMLTASPQDALRAFEVAAVDCLLKPLDEPRLAAAVRRAKAEVNRRRTEALGSKISHLLTHLQAMEAGRALPGAAAVAAPAAPAEGETITRDRILLKTGGEIYFLKSEEIDWIEAEGDYMKFHAAGRVHQLRETMGRLEERLDPRRFLRIHRSTIVNIDRVKKLSPDFAGEYAVVLQDGTKLRLSRGYHGRLQELMRDAL